MSRPPVAEGWYRATNRLGLALLRTLAVDIRWEGADHLPASGPVLLVSNHCSYPDFVFLERVAITRGRYVRFLCRADVWDAPGCARAMDGMGHVPVDRSTAAAAYLHVRRLLGQQQAVGLFPEAGVSYSWTVRALMRGAAALARETGAPVVPAAVWGGQRILTVGHPRGARPRPDLTRGRRVDVRFAPPFRVAAGEDLTTVTTRLGHQLQEMLEELQQRPHHRPRPGEYAPWYPAHLGGHAPDREEARALDSVPASAVPATWGPAVPC